MQAVNIDKAGDANGLSFTCKGGPLGSLAYVPLNTLPIPPMARNVPTLTFDDGMFWACITLFESQSRVL